MDPIIPKSPDITPRSTSMSPLPDQSQATELPPSQTLAPHEIPPKNKSNAHWILAILLFILLALVFFMPLPEYSSANRVNCLSLDCPRPGLSLGPSFAQKLLNRFESTIPKEESSVIPTETDTDSTLVNPKVTGTNNSVFTGNNTFTEVDDNGDGLFEAFVVNVEVQPSISGEYTISGVLQKNRATIANRPAFESMLFSSSFATFSNDPSSRIVNITFSGEQIFRSNQDGPYNLVLTGIGSDNKSSTQATYSTPAIDHTKFGEVFAVLIKAVDNLVDANGDGSSDYISVTVDINMRVPGYIHLQGDLSSGSGSIAGAGDSFNLEAGTHSLDLLFPGSDIRESGEDGPYNGTVTLIDNIGHTLQSITFVTQAYDSDSFNQ